MAWFYSPKSPPALHRAALGSKAPRVVSFLGAATEIVCLLGCEKLLVGRSHECRRPESVQILPCLSSAEPIASDVENLSSGEIDARVKGLVEKGLARYKIDAELLKRLEPDVILTQDQCSVCAITSQDLEAACSSFVHQNQKPCKVVSLRPLMMADVWKNVRQIAAALNVPERGEALIKSLQAGWKEVRESTPQYSDGMLPVNVACLQWTDPLIGAGFWVPEIVSCAGGVNLLGERGGGSPQVMFADLVQLQPEVIVVMCCGLDRNRGVRDVETLEKEEEWLQLRAVKNGRVFVVDGDVYFNTSSAAAAVESARLMAEILHGGRSGLEGRAYVRRPALAPAADVSSDVAPPPAISAPLLPTWLQDAHEGLGSNPHPDNPGVNGGVHANGASDTLDSPAVRSPLLSPRSPGLGRRTPQSAAHWGVNVSRPIAPPEGIRQAGGAWMGNESDESEKGLVFGAPSDTDDSDNDFEESMETHLPSERWSDEMREEASSELMRGLVLDSDLEGITVGMHAGQRSSESELDTSSKSRAESTTDHAISPTTGARAVITISEDLERERRVRQSREELGLDNLDLNSGSGFEFSKGWQEPRPLSPDSLRSSPTRWPLFNPQSWHDPAKGSQTLKALVSPPSLAGKNPFASRKHSESQPSRFADEEGRDVSLEDVHSDESSEKERRGDFESTVGSLEADHSLSGFDGLSFDEEEEEVRRSDFDLLGGDRGEGAVPRKRRSRLRKKHLSLEVPSQRTGLTLFEGPHSPYERTEPKGFAQGFESISLEGDESEVKGGAVLSPLERGGGLHSAFKRVKPSGRALVIDVSKKASADIIGSLSDVTPPQREPSPVQDPAIGDILSPMASRPGLVANLLEVSQTSPPHSPVRTPPLVRTNVSASPPRSPPNFMQLPNPADLPALMDLGSVPAIKTLSPIRTLRQFTPLPVSPPLSTTDAPKLFSNLELPRGTASPSPPSSPSLSPLSSPLGNKVRFENGLRPPRSPKSPQALASPRVSPLSVLPYLSLDSVQESWPSNPKPLNLSEFVEEVGLEPMESLAGGRGVEADVRSLEDDIKGSMERWMWGELGMEGVTAAAGLDAAQPVNSESAPLIGGTQMPVLDKKGQVLREVVEDAIQEALPADCLILSGGLDTCIIAEVATWQPESSADEIGDRSEQPWGSVPMREENQGSLEARFHTPQNSRRDQVSHRKASDTDAKRRPHTTHLEETSSSAEDSQKRLLERGRGAKAAHGVKAAITVFTGEHATDRPYAEEIAKRCGLEHIVIETKTPEELLNSELEFVVRTLRTFDPMEVRNSIAVAAALREAHRRGFRSAITGDGADEIFGGYSFTHGMSPEKFQEYRQHLKRVMHFSAVPLGEALGIQVRQPYLYSKLVDYALHSLEKEDLVGPVRPELLTKERRRSLESSCREEDLRRLEGQVVHGKLALREAFPGVFSAWRAKDPIEVGCGTTILPARLKEALSAPRLAAAQRQIQRDDGIKIRDAEHLHYYRAFRRVFGGVCPPGMVRFGSDPCTACGFQLQQPTQNFCVVCGEYPARNESGSVKQNPVNKKVGEEKAGFAAVGVVERARGGVSRHGSEGGGVETVRAAPSRTLSADSNDYFTDASETLEDSD